MKLPTVEQIEQMSREEFEAFMALFFRSEESEQKMTSCELNAEGIRLFVELKRKRPEACPIVIAMMRKMAELNKIIHNR